MIFIDRLADIGEIGGKAYHLFSLNIQNTPPLYVCPASYFDAPQSEQGRAALAEEIGALFSEKKLYAVRSSAADEDSDGDSFAGVHESYLSVKKEDILQTIEKVRASAFTERALAYRRARGLQTDRIRIAVIVQEMVNAEFAGVINTIDPVTDDPDKIVISVARGLGDKIVDGSENGSTYTFNHGKWTVRGEDILGRRARESILALAREVMQKTHSFQDIEFAYRRGRAYFLQARAITVYRGIDTHARGLLLDNSNIIESFFGVVSPLTYSFANDIYARVYRSALKMSGLRERLYDTVSPRIGEMLYCYEGKIYYNMNNWYFAASVLPFKNSRSYFDTMIGTGSKAGETERLRTNWADKMKFALVFLRKLLQIEKLAARFEADFGRIVMPYYGKKLSGTNAELLQIAASLEEITDGFVVPVINDCAVMYFVGKLSERAQKEGISAEDVNRYVYIGGVKSTGSAEKFAELVRMIRNNAEFLRDFRSLDEHSLAAKYGSGTPLSAPIRAYIHAYGARVMDELKLETVTMIEDETILYRMLKEGLEAKPNTAVRPAAEVPNPLRSLAAKARKYMQLRERLRIKRTYLYSVVRNIFLAFGENYRRAGRLEQARDIFYLTKGEVLSGEGDFLELVARRKALESEYRKKEVYDRLVFFGGVPLPVKSAPRGEGLCGIPSGGGTVVARVSLMNSAADTLVPGNIILTKRTDPGWISLFPLASGLIVEHGSMLSHSFVVARELNLPAVVGIAGATEKIQNGALVRLDGLRGEVTVLEEGGQAAAPAEG